MKVNKILTVFTLLIGVNSVSQAMNASPNRSNKYLFNNNVKKTLLQHYQNNNKISSNFPKSELLGNKLFESTKNVFRKETMKNLNSHYYTHINKKYLLHDNNNISNQFQTQWNKTRLPFNNLNGSISILNKNSNRIVSIQGLSDSEDLKEEETNGQRVVKDYNVIDTEDFSFNMKNTEGGISVSKNREQNFPSVYEKYNIKKNNQQKDHDEKHKNGKFETRNFNCGTIQCVEESEIIKESSNQSWDGSIQDMLMNLVNIKSSTKDKHPITERNHDSKKNQIQSKYQIYKRPITKMQQHGNQEIPIKSHRHQITDVEKSGASRIKNLLHINKALIQNLGQCTKAEKNNNKSHTPEFQENLGQKQHFSKKNKHIQCKTNFTNTKTTRELELENHKLKKSIKLLIGLLYEKQSSTPLQNCMNNNKKSRNYETLSFSNKINLNSNTNPNIIQSKSNQKSNNRQFTKYTIGCNKYEYIPVSSIKNSKIPTRLTKNKDYSGIKPQNSYGNLKLKIDRKFTGKKPVSVLDNNVKSFTIVSYNKKKMQKPISHLYKTITHIKQSPLEMHPISDKSKVNKYGKNK